MILPIFSSSFYEGSTRPCAGAKLLRQRRDNGTLIISFKPFQGLGRDRSRLIQTQLSYGSSHRGLIRALEPRKYCLCLLILAPKSSG
jgi:hypothetical protein